MHGCVCEHQHVDTVTCAATDAFWRNAKSACGWLNGQAAGQLRGLGQRGVHRRMRKAWQQKLERWEERDRPEKGGGVGIRGLK